MRCEVDLLLALVYITHRYNPDIVCCYDTEMGALQYIQCRGCIYGL